MAGGGEDIELNHVLLMSHDNDDVIHYLLDKQHVHDFKTFREEFDTQGCTINPKRIMQGPQGNRKASTDDPAAIIGTQDPSTPFPHLWEKNRWEPILWEDNRLLFSLGRVFLIYAHEASFQG